MRARLGSVLMWAFLCSWSCFLSLGLAATPSPVTPSPVTSSPESTPAPIVVPTPSPTKTPTPAPTLESSSSSTTSRGAVLAWALFTVALCVALLILLYNREQTKRRRIHPGDSLRQSLASADTLIPDPYTRASPPPAGTIADTDPTMSSF